MVACRFYNNNNNNNNLLCRYQSKNYNNYNRNNLYAGIMITVIMKRVIDNKNNNKYKF